MVTEPLYSCLTSLSPSNIGQTSWAPPPDYIYDTSLSKPGSDLQGLERPNISNNACSKASRSLPPCNVKHSWPLPVDTHAL